jgi:aerobic C4-dicarboxylate transport protein
VKTHSKSEAMMARQIPQTQSFKLPGYNWRRGKTGWDKHTWLYLAVIAAVVLGATIGLLWPEVGVALEPVGKGFVALIKMMIAPIIFCTIVVGIGSIAKAATVGKIGGLALLYFMVMTTFALAIGLLVGNIIHPGQGLDMASSTYDTSTLEPKTTQEFILGIIPTTLFSAFTGESVLQVLFVALLVGFALQQMGPKGEPIMNAVKHLQALVFRILGMILWLAPLGAFGAIAAVVGKTGFSAIVSLGILMVAFYITCAVFIFGILGTLLFAVARINIFSLMKYLAREYLLIVGTSSSESALPRLIAKMEHLGVSKPVVGITVPTGYSFNLDGTAIYLTMASLFIAAGMGMPMSIPEQIGLLAFMVIASKGAAGVTGAGLATLAGGLQAYRPDLVNGVGVIVGIDRFMSEGRAITNFTGNAVATVLIGTWTKEIDKSQVRRVLAGDAPFDETTLTGDHDGMSEAPDAVGTQDLEEAAVAEAAEKERRAQSREEALTR